MPLQIIHCDLTTFPCDAIVNPTDPRFSGSGGTDRAVHTAAGPELARECSGLTPTNTGEITVTGAYDLPCRYVFHTVGPIWRGGTHNEPVLLRSCYLNALLKAKELGLASIAFPLIASGTYGFPKDKVLKIATEAISDFLFTTDGELEVTLCVLDRHAYEFQSQLALDIYLQRGDMQPSAAVCCSSLPEPKAPRQSLRGKRRLRGAALSDMAEANERIPLPDAACYEDAMPFEFLSASACEEADQHPVSHAMSSMKKPEMPLSEWIARQDDSFSLTLLKLIDRKGMTDLECYKKANITKGTFWKINNDPKYKPSKSTVISFAIALELDLDETSQLLRTVGFALSNSNTFDRIIQFFILNRIYNIYEINSALFQYDQPLLAC